MIHSWNKSKQALEECNFKEYGQNNSGICELKSNFHIEKTSTKPFTSKNSGSINKLGLFSINAILGLSDEANNFNLSNTSSDDSRADATSFEKTNHRKPKRKAHKYNCIVCDSTFKTNAHLERHYLIHTGIRPYVCSICGASFAQPTNYEYHLRIHKRQLPYVCPACPKKFRSSSHVNRHMRVHTGERPYACDLCPKAFKNWEGKDKHTKNCHFL